MGDDTYTHGHHESVLRSHRWRTAANSAAHLLPHLRAGQRVLDIGCGPGTITVDLARAVAPGAVLGIDRSGDVVEAAARFAADAVGENASKGLSEDGITDGSDDGNPVPKVTFAVGDVYALDHPDASFDVVHAHQVLQHLTDPVAALQELRRVLAPGGVLAARDSNYAAFWWSPDEPRLDRWLALYHRITESNRADADAGRHLLGWAHAAGFTDVEYSSSTWTMSTDADRAWWGGLWADRVVSSDFATQAVERGLSTPAELADLADGFRTWAASPDAVFVVPHGEIVAHR